MHFSYEDERLDSIEQRRLDESIDSRHPYAEGGHIEHML